MDDEFFEDDPPRITRAVIAGAAEALKQKSGDFKRLDGDILQDITDNIEKILDGID